MLRNRKSTDTNIALTADMNAKKALKEIDKLTKEMKKFGTTTTKGLKKTGEGLKKTGEGLDNVTKKLPKMRYAAKGMGKSFQNQLSIIRNKLLVLVFAITLVRKATSGLVDAKKMKSAANEIQSKFNVVFEGLSEKMNRWAEDFGAKMGRAKSDIKKGMADIMDTLKPSGFGINFASEMSKNLIALSADVGSFNDKLDADVLRDFLSALIGVHKPVAKYGIIITETALKQEALNTGLKKSFQEFTNMEKIQLRYNLILKGSKDAMGDVLRTADEDANLTKRRKAMYNDLQVVIGEKLIPISKAYNKILIEMMDKMHHTTGETKAARESLEDYVQTGSKLEDLIDNYKELKDKSELGADEQDRLKAIIGDIAAITPGAITILNEYAEAIDISTAAAKNLYETELAYKRFKHQEELQASIDDYSRLTKEITCAKIATQEQKKIVNERAEAIEEIANAEKRLTGMMRENKKKYGDDYLKHLAENGTVNILEYMKYIRELKKEFEEVYILSDKQRKAVEKLNQLSLKEITIVKENKNAIRGLAYEFGQYLNVSDGYLKMTEMLTANFNITENHARRLARTIAIIYNKPKPKIVPDPIIPDPPMLEKDAAKIVAKYYSDMKFAAEGYYEYRKEQIDKYAKELKKAGMTPIEIDAWKNKQLVKLEKDKDSKLLDIRKKMYSSMSILDNKAYQQKIDKINEEATKAEEALKEHTATEMNIRIKAGNDKASELIRAEQEIADGQIEINTWKNAQLKKLEEARTKEMIKAAGIYGEAYYKGQQLSEEALGKMSKEEKERLASKIKLIGKFSDEVEGILINAFDGAWDQIYDNFIDMLKKMAAKMLILFILSGGKASFGDLFKGAFAGDMAGFAGTSGAGSGGYPGSSGGYPIQSINNVRNQFAADREANRYIQDNRDIVMAIKDFQESYTKNIGNVANNVNRQRSQYTKNEILTMLSEAIGRGDAIRNVRGR